MFPEESKVNAPKQLVEVIQFYTFAYNFRSASSSASNNLHKFWERSYQVILKLANQENSGLSLTYNTLLLMIH